MELGASHWLWLLLGVPLVAALASWLWRRRFEATAAWASRGLWRRLMPGFSRQRLVWSVASMLGALACLIVALSQPRWGTKEQQVEREGVDLVVVLDTSLSMAARDVQPNRLWVAQTLIRQLVERLPGHRVALLQAEGDGVVMAPLTSDTAVIDLLLDGVQPGALPMPGTELAPALEKAAELFTDQEGRHRAMIVVSDGEDHGDSTRKVAERLAKEGVVIHSIGVGTLQGTPIHLPESAAQESQFKLDEEGKVVVSHLVESNLEDLARTTDGLYLRASSGGTSLQPLIDRIESMERRKFGSETLELLEERFQWPLMLAMLLLLAHLAVAPFGPEEGS